MASKQVLIRDIPCRFRFGPLRLRRLGALVLFGVLGRCSASSPHPIETSGLRLDFIHVDGTVVASRRLGGVPDMKAAATLAVSPDGERIAVADAAAAYLLDRMGRIIWRETHGSTRGYYLLPVFSPDSRRVAFKYLGREEKNLAVSFHSSDGKQLRRTTLPIDNPIADDRSRWLQYMFEPDTPGEEAP